MPVSLMSTQLVKQTDLASLVLHLLAEPVDIVLGLTALVLGPVAGVLAAACLSPPCESEPAPMKLSCIACRAASRLW